MAPPLPALILCCVVLGLGVIALCVGVRNLEQRVKTLENAMPTPITARMPPTVHYQLDGYRTPLCGPGPAGRPFTDNWADVTCYNCQRVRRLGTQYTP